MLIEAILCCEPDGAIDRCNRYRSLHAADAVEMLGGGGSLAGSTIDPHPRLDNAHSQTGFGFDIISWNEEDRRAPKSLENFLNLLPDSPYRFPHQTSPKSIFLNSEIASIFS
jgi:hypothetical protein